MSDIAERERTLASRLRLAVVRLNRRLRAQRADSALTLSQLSALSCLHKAGSMTPGELAAKEGVQPPSMTRVIAALEDNGLVVRRAHPTDGRQAIVQVTDSGKDRIEEEVTIRERWLDQHLAELDAEELAVLSRAAEIIDRLASR
ncbi:MarR family transcriptional regulator [Saccharopolyspora aridisoli]|uniref:MarR family transcriptional regulator n=1 Tax=Saccharopolyspora aridisoli TaxID=2530385 RepID=A0A4V2Y8F4_9PSEU|nr:MarR family transcriptional regulator [Saccharopolyspora aridisoli]TDC95745.1 MarR family transcriptional regulator [Saccharopolyspora aridisoli]